MPANWKATRQRSIALDWIRAAANWTAFALSRDRDHREDVTEGTARTARMCHTAPAERMGKGGPP